MSDPADTSKILDFTYRYSMKLRDCRFIQALGLLVSLKADYACVRNIRETWVEFGCGNLNLGPFDIVFTQWILGRSKIQKWSGRRF